MNILLCLTVRDDKITSSIKPQNRHFLFTQKLACECTFICKKGAASANRCQPFKNRKWNRTLHGASSRDMVVVVLTLRHASRRMMKNRQLLVSDLNLSFSALCTPNLSTTLGHHRVIEKARFDRNSVVNGRLSQDN